MMNTMMQVDGDILKIEVDLSKEHGRSKSGKNIIIASSEGIVPVPGKGDVKMGLNVFKAPK